MNPAIEAHHLNNLVYFVSVILQQFLCFPDADTKNRMQFPLDERSGSSFQMLNMSSSCGKNASIRYDLLRGVFNELFLDEYDLVSVIKCVDRI